MDRRYALNASLGPDDQPLSVAIRRVTSRTGYGHALRLSSDSHDEILTAPFADR
jgi:hypothetical protein